MNQIIAFLLLFTFAESRQITPEDKIRGFLGYLNSKDWSVDTVIQHYVVFRKEESPKVSRAKRKEYLNFALQILSAEIKEKVVNVSELKIVPYNNADSSMRMMFLSSEDEALSYIAYNTNKSFIRYFLVEDNRIRSFVTFKDGKVFLLLN